MSQKHYLVTGGTGFIGSALVRALISAGNKVRVFDNDSRGSFANLKSFESKLEFVKGDIRNPNSVAKAIKGVDSVCHLAFVNGTKFFYERPDLVLDVGVRGMLNVLDACKTHSVRELILASSSEVYQTPLTVPTNETVSLSIPDPLNPRYSYGAGKIISEMLSLHCAKDLFDRVLIFRPHNVYGPCMGWEHVVPEFIVRMLKLSERQKGVIPFPIQGSGKETRSFVFIDDFTQGLMAMIENGEHRNIYHIGTTEELSVSEVAFAVARCLNIEIKIVPGALAKGGTLRRCPDISKIGKLGYSPKFTLETGLLPTIKWYRENISLAPSSIAA